MARSRRKTAEERPVFSGIRKPTAPPTKTFGKAKPEEKARPSLRKIKHKAKAEPTDRDADI